MIRTFLGVLVGALCSAALGAAAQTSTVPVKKDTATLTFSNLVLRLEGEDSIGLAKADLRVMILEQLRADGFNAKGAENLVFGIDKSRDADFALGGTVRELECKNRYGRVDACRIGIDWELFHFDSERVVYRVRSRFAAFNLHQQGEAQIVKQLVLGALRSLAQRSRFVATLGARHERERDPSYAAASFASCPAPARPMPAQAESAPERHGHRERRPRPWQRLLHQRGRSAAHRRARGAARRAGDQDAHGRAAARRPRAHRAPARRGAAPDRAERAG